MSQVEDAPTRSCPFVLRYVHSHLEGIIFIITTIIFVPLAFSYESKADRCLMIIYTMAIFYATSAAPVFATTMIPIFAFPVLGIMSTKETYEHYFKDTFVMFSGYYAAAMESSQLHIRASYAILLILGCSPRRVHFATCIVIMFFSMWITNTACTGMMIGAVDSILLTLKEVGLCTSLHKDDENLPEERRYARHFKACFYLSAAYASSIGGCGCTVGSPTNFVISAIYTEYFPTSPQRNNVGRHMLYAFPIVIVCTLLMWIDLEIVFMGLFRPDSEHAKAVTFDKDSIDSALELINAKYRALGPLTTQEISVIVLFITLVLAYITRDPEFFLGWSLYFETDDPMNTVPEVCLMLLLFVLPANYNFCTLREPPQPAPGLLAWEFALQRVPWNLIFLVGSGTALSAGVKMTGLDSQIAKSLEDIKEYHHSIALLFLITATVLATNITANITTATLAMPILARTANYMNVHPLYVIMPANIACSMAFMLPGATPSNLNVRERGQITRTTMFIGGILPTITSIFAIWVINNFWCEIVYPIINDTDEIRRIYILANQSFTI